MKISNQLLQEFREEKKYHQHFMTSYELHVPDIEIEKKHMVMTTQMTMNDEFKGLKQGVVWLDGNHYPDQLSKLLINFQREEGDNTPPDKTVQIKNSYSYILAFPQFKKGFVYDKHKALGFLKFENDALQFCWIHPIIRNRGIMQNFLISYMINEKPLFIVPPIRKEMQMILEKVQKKVYENKELFTRYCALVRGYFDNKGVKNMEYLEDDEVIQFLSLHSMTTSFMQKELDPQQAEIYVYLILKMRDEQFSKEFKESFKEINAEKCKNYYQEFMDTGKSRIDLLK